MHASGAANEMMQYSFLSLFARGRTITEAGLSLLERLALRGGRVDSEERAVLPGILDRVDVPGSGPGVATQVNRLRTEYAIDLLEDGNGNAADRVQPEPSSAMVAWSRRASRPSSRSRAPMRS